MVMRNLAGVIFGALSLAGCSGPDYTPVPDKQLFAQIKSIPGVTESHVMASKDMPSGDPIYGGQIVIAEDADPIAILDQVFAILWQGEPGAGYGGITVLQNDMPTSDFSVGLLLDDDFKARYGPQPGTGKPPTDKPPLKRVE